jgi:hypothetical protein
MGVVRNHQLTGQDRFGLLLEKLRAAKMHPTDNDHLLNSCDVLDKHEKQRSDKVTAQLQDPNSTSIEPHADVPDKMPTTEPKPSFYVPSHRTYPVSNSNWPRVHSDKKSVLIIGNSLIKQLQPHLFKDWSITIEVAYTIQQAMLIMS